MSAYTTVDIPVAGGELRAGVWGRSGPLVVAVHGTTAHHLAWEPLARDLVVDHRIVAVDLRGRGGSRELPPPYGVAAHVDDLAAVVEELGEGPVIIVGHSIGGTVAVEAARQGLASRLVLTDGGPLQPPPEGVPVGAGESEIAAAVARVVGPAFGRLTRTFDSPQEYLAFWRAHPALALWPSGMDDFVRADLVPTADGRWRSACLLAAAERDSVDLYNWTGAPEEPVPVPTMLLRAERGLLDEPDRPFYPPGYGPKWLPGVDERTVPGVNHYTLVLGDAGAAVIAAAVRG
jgi:lipase